MAAAEMKISNASNLQRETDHPMFDMESIVSCEVPEVANPGNLNYLSR